MDRAFLRMDLDDSNQDRKARRREKRRKEILDAAEHLFFAKYYDDVSMDDIAGKIDLSKATLYLYFKDKDAIFFAVVLRGMRFLWEMVQNAVQESENGIDRIALLGFAGARWGRKYPHYFRLFTYFRSGRFAITKMTDNDDVREIQQIMSGLWIETITGIRMGLDDGTIRPGITPEVLAVLLLTLSEGVNSLHPGLKKMLGTKGIDHTRFSNQYIDLVYNMIENPGQNIKRRSFHD